MFVPLIFQTTVYLIMYQILLGIAQVHNMATHPHKKNKEVFFSLFHQINIYMLLGVCDHLCWFLISVKIVGPQNFALIVNSSLIKYPKIVHSCCTFYIYGHRFFFFFQFLCNNSLIVWIYKSLCSWVVKYLWSIQGNSRHLVLKHLHCLEFEFPPHTHSLGESEI